MIAGFLDKALSLSDFKTKKEIVEEGLKLLILQKNHAKKRRMIVADTTAWIDYINKKNGEAGI